MEIMNCATCSKELVYISVDTHKQSIKELAPNYKTLRKINPKKYAVCPQCDAYALGIELIEGYPITLQDGTLSSIDKLEKELW